MAEALLDIHIGVVREHLVQSAIASATTDWTQVHLVRGCTSMWELRSQGYALGSAEYVSFVDDDDVFLNIEIIKSEIQKGTPAFFTNSRVIRPSHTQLNYKENFAFTGIKSFKAAKPHNPFVVRRDVMAAAIKAAEASMLAHKEYENSADLAISCEIQRSVGWTYVPHVCYQWNVSPDSISLSSPEMFVQANKFYLASLGVE